MLSHCPSLCLSVLGEGVFGGSRGRGFADVLDSFQAAIIYFDCVPVQAAETSKSI